MQSPADSACSLLPRPGHRFRLWVAAAAWAAFMLQGAAGQEQGVTFEVRPRALSVGEVGEAVFTITGIPNAPAPEMARPAALHVQPTPSRMDRSITVPGRTTRIRTYTYRFAPRQAGEIEIAPPPYAVNGATYRFDPIALTAVERPDGQAAMNEGERLFARLTTDRAEVYIQEAFDVILSIYSYQLDLGGNIALDGLPGSGLSFQDFVQLPEEREVVDGRVYDVRRYRSRVRALTAGRFTVELTANVPVVVQQPSRRGSLLDMQRFFGPPTRQVPVRTEALDFDVLPLPRTDRPASFTGAVGEFNFEVQVRPARLQAGEPVTVTMEISGRGNIDSVSAPSLETGPDFKVYDARLVSKKMNETQALGRKVFEQVVIPRSADVTELPPVAFSFFEPASAAYRTLQQGPFAPMGYRRG